MSNKKKNSRVGMGMKPRVQQEAAKSEVEPARVLEGMSATEGQYGGQIRAESAPSEPVETGGRLEEKPVQNLDSENLAVVPAEDACEGEPCWRNPDTGQMEFCSKHEGIAMDKMMAADRLRSQQAGFVDPPQRDPLEELMGKWPGEAIGAIENRADLSEDQKENLREFADASPGTYGAVERGTGDHTTPGLRNMTEEELQKLKDNHPLIMVQRQATQVTIAEIEAVMANGRIVNIEPDGRVVLSSSVGQRSDGTFGLVVSIPEGMIEPIREQAASDSVTPEDWVSTRLLEYMESWWSAPKGR